ncbi:DNA adenine methylase [Volucribacter amazonae]|uniref:D12 class N6 adenine-specific DNA methyltransferase n=1 Tax=Volucribacter amazonae TaxID=256731 RepID=A0A9X4PCU2_9PAST|nr:DNA adenine methylase [Volucribacter amazonae]MDG6895026.1 hypothetical protein [Volucribacter amazonae]
MANKTKSLHFTQAPLPFVGQKRLFLNQFKALLNQHLTDDGEGWTIVDVFGGSGLLSHVAKQIKPKARVIYNDYDSYAERLAHIDDINRLRAELWQLLDGKVESKKRLPPALKQQVIAKIEAFKGSKDLNTLVDWLLFSGQQAATFEDFYRQDFWFRVRKTPYASAEHYLDGLEIVSESFHQLMPKFQDNPKALLILDPPYLCTHQASYRQAHYFDLIDFLRLINLTRPPYLFFSSTKSEFIRFIDYMIEDKVDNWQIFESYQRIVNTSTSYAGRYEDNLVYKF